MTIKRYYHPSPNPAKVALYLEETGLPYEVVAVDTRRGDAWAQLPNVKRLLDEINARPAAQRAEALKTQHSFKAEMDESARQAMFPQNARLAPSTGATA